MLAVFTLRGCYLHSLSLVKSLARCRKSSKNVPEMRTHGHAGSLLRSKHRRAEEVTRGLERSEEEGAAGGWGVGGWNVLTQQGILW